MSRTLSPVAKGMALPPADDGRITVTKSAGDLELERACQPFGAVTPDNMVKAFTANPGLHQRYVAQFRR